MAAAKYSLETILVVEDDPIVLKSVRCILEAAGFHVLTAANSTEAIQIESGFYETIHLLLSDVMMPDMSGPVISKILKKFRPEMRVMLMSGYPQDELALLNDGWQFIQKPFVPAKLVAKVNEMLHHAHKNNGTVGCIRLCLFPIDIHQPFDQPRNLHEMMLNDEGS